MESETRRLLSREIYPAGVEGVTQRFVALASGLTVRVVEAGEPDAPPVVFVPGWGCTAWIFHDTLLPVASAGFRAIAIELKGHGLSDKPLGDGEYTLESMRDHVLDILDALEIGHAGMVGHSMGAAIAAHAAAIARDRVTGLVFAAPVGFAGVKGMGVFRALTPEFAAPIVSSLATKGLVRVMLRIVYGSLRGPSQRDVDEFHAPTAFPEFTRALRQLLHEFDWNAECPKLTIPTMTIVGEEDIMSPAGDASRYADRTVVIDRSGHVLFDEAPATVNSEIVSFFGAVARPYISGQ